MVYLDTSALAKWYLNEPNSGEFVAWLQTQGDLRISSLTEVEMRCLLARRVRNRELDEALSQQIFATFQDDVAQGQLILSSVEDAWFGDALNLISTLHPLPLRTLDALHLAIARGIGVTGVASADTGMLNAAERMGLDVVRFD